MTDEIGEQQCSYTALDTKSPTIQRELYCLSVTRERSAKSIHESGTYSASCMYVAMAEKEWYAL